MQTLKSHSGHTNARLTGPDQTVMVFIVAMGTFTAILLEYFLFMIFPKLSLKEKIIRSYSPAGCE